MSERSDRTAIPTLPQSDDAARRERRLYELSLARTAYNYTTSYLPPAPLAAQVPAHEKFSLAYKAKVAPVLLEVTENLKQIVLSRFEGELKADLPTLPMPWMVELDAAFKAAEKQFSGISELNPLRDLEALRAIARAIAGAPPELQAAFARLALIPRQIQAFESSIKDAVADINDVGVTAFLKDTLYEELRGKGNGDAYLHAKTLDEFATLYPGFPYRPRVLTLPRQAWLPHTQQMWQTDWYFGWLQTAGFNTTNLRGVFPRGDVPEMALGLDALMAKMPVDDAMLRAASGDPELTLARAAEQGRLFALDMTILEGRPQSTMHGDTRYVTAPIALFCWNPQPGPGYPPGRGSLQPVAIQLGQKHDAGACPVFTPGGDPVKWALAKYFVLSALAIHHETIAHLGACHLTVETMIVATRRQLSAWHPVLALLEPHFRFTLDINEGAKHSLIIPGGVVASVLSPSIEGSLGLVRDARLAWRLDQNLPHRLFALRGVDTDRLPDFPFRDDTLLLWDAIRAYVRQYLSLYYASDADVSADVELRAWVAEITSPTGAAFQGLGGLKDGKLDRLDYLTDLVSLLVYTAGPQHANVNYAQYPLMSYLPSVSGTAYAPPPTAHAGGSAEAEMLKVLPPIDVSLYQLSFGFLLSSVQYDTFGHYSENPRRPYFADERAEAAAVDLRLALNRIEQTIHERNQSRPMPYENQLPSMIPNSISI